MAVRYRALPPPRCMAVDVDGTLIINGRVNQAMVESVNKALADGYQIIVWSMRGRAYAEAAAARVGLTGDDVQCCSKPGVIVDDVGLEWLKGVRVLRR